MSQTFAELADYIEGRPTTIQVQKKKQLTFEEICNGWSEIFKGVEMKGSVEYRRLVPREGFNISKSEYCVVGEAHGFSNGYLDSCKVCKSFSMGQDGFVSAYFSYDEVYRQRVIDDFVQHWNECHLG